MCREHGDRKMAGMTAKSLMAAPPMAPPTAKAVSLHESEALGEVLVATLSSWVERNEQRPILRLALTPFHGMRVPPIGLCDYVQRIMRYAGCSPVCYIITYALLRRLAARSTDMLPTHLNAHRLVLVSVLLAVKSHEDIHYDNVHFSKVGGLPVAELNSLELHMLNVLNFDLNVSLPELEEAEAEMVREVRLSSLVRCKDAKQQLEKLGLFGGYCTDVESTDGKLDAPLKASTSASRLLSCAEGADSRRLKNGSNVVGDARHMYVH